MDLMRDMHTLEECLEQVHDMPICPRTHITQSTVGLTRRYCNFSVLYYYLSQFYKSLCADCSIRVFQSFLLIWFFKCKAFVLSGTTTNRLASKEFLDMLKMRKR